MPARQLSVAVHSARRLVGEALAISLAAEPELVVAGHTHDWAQLTVLCRLRRPEVLVVEATDDLDQATLGLRGLTRRWPALLVVLICGPLSAMGNAKVAAAGVHLLVPHERGFAALVAALHEQVVRLQSCASARVRHAMLTDRELDVLRLVGAGLTVPEAAKLLGIGPRSVENHKRRIYAKLGAHSQALAVSSVATMGLLDSRPHQLSSSAELSPRERDLLRLASHGASMRQMAHSLGIAPKTVESQLSRLYGKLGVHNRAAALAVAHAFGLVPEENHVP